MEMNEGPSIVVPGSDKGPVDAGVEIIYNVSNVDADNAHPAVSLKVEELPEKLKPPELRGRKVLVVHAIVIGGMNKQLLIAKDLMPMFLKRRNPTQDEVVDGRVDTYLKNVEGEPFKGYNVDEAWELALAAAKHGIDKEAFRRTVTQNVPHIPEGALRETGRQLSPDQ